MERAAKRELVSTLGDVFNNTSVVVVAHYAGLKVAVDFAKANDKLVILGGAMGATSLNVDGVKALATLPSLDELRGKLVGLIQAPATKVAQLANAPAAKLARVFGAYAKTGEAA